MRRSAFSVCVRKTLPFRHVWLLLQCGQIRSPAHPLSKVVSHLRHRRGLRSQSTAGWLGSFVTVFIRVRQLHLITVIPRLSSHGPMGLQPRAAAAANQTGFGSAVAPPCRPAERQDVCQQAAGGLNHLAIRGAVRPALHMEGAAADAPSHYSRAEPWIALPLGSDGAAVRGNELPDAPISALAVAGWRLSPLVAGEVIDGTPGEEHL